jgi:hypothetical protein
MCKGSYIGSMEPDVRHIDIRGWGEGEIMEEEEGGEREEGDGADDDGVNIERRYVVADINDEKDNHRGEKNIKQLVFK